MEHWNTENIGAIAYYIIKIFAFTLLLMKLLTGILFVYMYVHKIG